MQTTVLLLVILGHLLIKDLVHGKLYIAKDSKGVPWRQRHRVKRGWTYPPMNVPETIAGQSFTPYKLATIKSDNPNVAQYKFGTPSYPTIFVMQSTASGGEIWLQQGLDRETRPKYTLQALALNDVGTQVETPAEIEVVVLDSNDNKPVFDATSLAGSVFEDQTSGDFMNLQATDADSSYQDNNVVRFTYKGNEQPPSSDGRARFEVSEQGVVSVVGSLDAELEPTVTFEVEAKDGLPGGLGNAVTATVTVTVKDSNDHAPVFTNEPYVTTKGELTPVQTTLISVYATDIDQGVNKAVYFKITGGDTTGTFSVKSHPSEDPSRGDIVLEKLMDFESGIISYTLTVTAYNKEASNADVTAYQATTTVVINVSDENEPPVFKKDSYTASVQENVASLPELVKTVAVDKDYGGSQVVKYKLLNSNGWFAINGDGGISVVAPIDRENPLIDQPTSTYELKVEAYDNYEPTPASSTAVVVVTVGDVNDNAPEISAKSQHVVFCEYPQNGTYLEIVDKDTPGNGPPFQYSVVDMTDWFVERYDSYQAILATNNQKLPLSTGEESFINVPITIADRNGVAGSNTGTSTVKVEVCSCNADGEPVCQAPVVAGAGFSIPALIAIIAAILILLIIVLAVVAYRRRRSAEDSKIPLFDDDDVRENLQAYHDEGGGEEDNEGYDINTLTSPPPLMAEPKRVDAAPLGSAAVPQPRRIPPDTDIGDYIADAKRQADNDPTAPPFDSLLVFDYEGQGSDAGSLSSLNSGTTDGSQDYNYLNNWGPRFKKLADMYGGEDEN